jgi:hypothetical protein
VADFVCLAHRHAGGGGPEALQATTW